MNIDGPPAGHPRFDDFEIGAVYRSYRRTVTETDLVSFTSFAGLRLPIFVDEEFAREQSPHGGRIAPGFLTASLSAGMIESVLGPDLLAGLALDDFQFHVPVRPGDTLRAEIAIEEKRVTRAGDRGILKFAVRVRNQQDQVPLEYRSTVLMHRRAA